VVDGGEHRAADLVVAAEQPVGHRQHLAALDTLFESPEWLNHLAESEPKLALQLIGTLSDKVTGRLWQLDPGPRGQLTVIQARADTAPAIGKLCRETLAEFAEQARLPRGLSVLLSEAGGLAGELLATKLFVALGAKLLLGIEVLSAVLPGGDPLVCAASQHRPGEESDRQGH